MPGSSLIPPNFLSWQTIDGTSAGLAAAHAGATSAQQSGLGVLMQWGPIYFQVWPLNFNELDHDTSTDWAKKEIAGAAIYREWVGEGDEIITVRGMLFPYRIGGYSNILVFDGYRRSGTPQLMLSGGISAMNLGWYVCEHLTRQHQSISAEGIGQQISFEARFARCPVPSVDQMIGTIFGLSGTSNQGTVVSTPSSAAAQAPAA